MRSSDTAKTIERGGLVEEERRSLRRSWLAGTSVTEFLIGARSDPVQPGGPPLWLAVSSEPGVARAVRYGTHVLPQGPRRLLDNWRASMRAAGADPTAQRVGIIRTCLVTDDPERDWPPLRDAERYRMRVYSSLSDAAGSGGRATFDDPERITQRVIVGDVDHCANELISFIREFELTDVVTWGSAPVARYAANIVGRMLPHGSLASPA